MKFIKIGGAVLLLAIVGVAGAAAMQPDRVHVERSKFVNADPGDVYPYANDFDRWVKWNPWMDLDPDQKLEYSEKRTGEGAWYSWKGEKSGAGKMTIAKVVPNQKVEHDLEFKEPFPSNADVTMSFSPEKGGTKVTWAYDAENNFMGKMFGLFVDMDQMLGADFEKGLGKLAPMAEADAKARKEAEAAALAAEQAAAAEAAAQAAAAGATPPDAPPSFAPGQVPGTVQQ